MAAVLLGIGKAIASMLPGAETDDRTECHAG